MSHGSSCWGIRRLMEASSKLLWHQTKELALLFSWNSHLSFCPSPSNATPVFLSSYIPRFILERLYCGTCRGTCSLKLEQILHQDHDNSSWINCWRTVSCGSTLARSQRPSKGREINDAVSSYWRFLSSHNGYRLTRYVNYRSWRIIFVASSYHLV